MATTQFQNFVKKRAIMPVPLPSGDHPHRAERKQGFLKEVNRIIKTGFPTALARSLVPHLVTHAEMQVNATVSQFYLALRGEINFVGNWNSPHDIFCILSSSGCDGI